MFGFVDGVMVNFILAYHEDMEHTPEWLGEFASKDEAIKAYHQALKSDLVFDDEHWLELYEQESGETLLENSP